jgi:hypothetical protein
MASVSDQAAARPTGGAHAAEQDGSDHDLTLLGNLAVVLVIGSSLVVTARIGALPLLVATAVVQALVAVAWALGTSMPGRNGALLIAAAAAAGSDVTVSIWPHSRLGTLVIVFALAVPLMFVHQLSRGAARVRVVESLSGVAMLVALVTSLSAYLQLRHEFLPASTGGHVVAGVLEAAAGALVVGYLVDMIMPSPRFDVAVPRGLLAVVAAAGLGGSVGHLALTDGSDFQGARGTFAGAALGALVGFFAVAVAFLQASTPRPASRTGRGLRVVVAAGFPICLSAPVAFLLLLAIRA